jgi:hypothetical protein
LHERSEIADLKRALNISDRLLNSGGTADGGATGGQGGMDGGGARREDVRTPLEQASDTHMSERYRPATGFAVFLDVAFGLPQWLGRSTVECLLHERSEGGDVVQMDPAYTAEAAALTATNDPGGGGVVLPFGRGTVFEKKGVWPEPSTFVLVQLFDGAYTWSMTPPKRGHDVVANTHNVTVVDATGWHTAPTSIIHQRHRCQGVRMLASLPPSECAV